MFIYVPPNQRIYMCISSIDNYNSISTSELQIKLTLQIACMSLSCIMKIFQTPKMLLLENK